MNSGPVEASGISTPILASPTSTAAEDDSEQQPARRLSGWTLVAGALTLAMVVGLGRQLFSAGLSGLFQIVPQNPLFYATFLLVYLSPAAFDFVIFRRLWGIPAEGFVALMKKRIANDVLVGYSGDAYFYSWARQRSRMVSAPFGAVKDSSILSAIAGNGVTLATMLVALPFGWHLLTNTERHALFWSLAVITAVTVPWLLLSKRVFSLPKPMLWWIFGMHCLRMITGAALTALAWHFAMPEVSLGAWLLLSAAKLLVNRLPLIPNKDLLFANLAILLLGSNRSLVDLLAFMAALTLVVHVVLLVAFAVDALVRKVVGGAADRGPPAARG
jgi:hypothetical protein